MRILFVLYTCDTFCNMKTFICCLADHVPIRCDESFMFIFVASCMERKAIFVGEEVLSFFVLSEYVFFFKNLET